MLFHSKAPLRIGLAGGGGFMIFYCPAIQIEKVKKALQLMDGKLYPFHFEPNGLTTFTSF